LLIPGLLHAAGEPRDPGSPGAFLYSTYCLNCHGENARGNGPMADVLNVKPADLTTLAARNGGEFPAEEVARTIDGRDVPRGHGARQMPIWGLTFQQLDSDANQEDEVRRKIEALVRYLASLQRASDEQQQDE